MQAAALPEQMKAPVTIATAFGDRCSGKYLAFHLGKEEFGIHVLKILEIIGVQDVTSVPSSPIYVKGVINLRGKVIPVIDLRAKFGLPQVEYTKRTCIIVVQVEGERTPVLMGVVVDGVSEVLNIGAQEIEASPNFGTGESIPYILGMAKMKDGVKMLLDINVVLSRQELRHLGSVDVKTSIENESN